MKKNLQSLYIKTDTSCKELAKTALAQLVLKIVYSLGDLQKLDAIKQELNGVLDSHFNDAKVQEILDFLVDEKKLIDSAKGYKLSSSKRNIFDQVYAEYLNRQSRIIKRYFSKTKSDEGAIINWFENVTLKFFNEFRSEWIAQKAYKVHAKNAYDGLSKVVKSVTHKEKNILEEDKDWLCSQYLAFFRSNDPELEDIFWDYGTASYSSSLITSANSANQVTIDILRDSKIIIDTNVLIDLHLEGGQFYSSYQTLGQIFKELGINSGYLHISRDEYVRSIANKKQQILNIVGKYDDEILAELDEDFVQTARGRKCETEEDYLVFFDELMDPPTSFAEEMDISLFDDKQIDQITTEGSTNEELIDSLNNIFINRYPKKKKDDEEEEAPKNKSRKPLEHDAGLISAAEYLRKSNQDNKAFILTREYTVKKYGVQNALREDPPISLGLESLISVLAIDSGGINVDPTNIKPLFAKMIKLALLPEKGSFQTSDLARMLDIEQNIADLPIEDVKSIASEMHRLQLADVPDGKVSVEITRRFQTSKMTLKGDVVEAKAAIAVEQGQKDKFKKSSEVSELALKKSIKKDVLKEISNWLLKMKLLYFLVFPILTLGFTFIIIQLNDLTNLELWQEQSLALSIEVIGWFLGDLFYFLPKLSRKHVLRKKGVDKEVNERLIIQLENAS